MTRRIINWAAKTALLLLVSVPAVGVCRGQIAAEDFGTVKYLKQCPEYKRGYDPYANLSGTLQENVDVYSGKLNITFPLPTVPWGATNSFGLVLIYNSNIWMKQESAAVTVGGETATGKTLAGPSENPGRQRDKMVMTFPEFWCNDSFVRFSPIGRPHAMPGWTLTVGGVYTEYCGDPEPLSPCFVYAAGETPLYLYRTVKKKFFVAPDGSTHLLVDFQTNCRPYISVQRSQEGTSENQLAEQCSVTTGQDPQTVHCLPSSGAGQARVWRAMDGSGYYYIEKLITPVNTSTQGDVYGPDGTRYELDGNGMISSITDIDQNKVNISSSVDYSNGTPTRKTITYASGSAQVQVVFKYLELPHWKPILVDSGTATDWEYAPVACWLLEKVTFPNANNGTQNITFANLNLISHLNSPTGNTIRWKDLFQTTVVPTGGAGTEPIDTSDFVFCTTKEPPKFPNKPALLSPTTDMTLVSNSNVYVLSAITLPDGRQFSFQYNIAGKIQKVTYPDGGCRVYWYGNTPARSHSQQAFFLESKTNWNSALGGVSVVWKGDPSKGGEIEQALAYSFPKENPDVSQDHLVTFVWKGDTSAEVHEYMVQPSSQSKVLQFGFGGWTMGKPYRVKRYNLANNSISLNDLETYFNPSVSDIYNTSYIVNVQNMFGNTAALMQQETYSYKNADSTWKWTVPTALCASCVPVDPTDDNINCYYSDILSDYYTGPGHNPESGNVMTEKELISQDGRGLKKVFRWKYEEKVDGPNGWMEPNALLVSESESDWSKPASPPTGFRTKCHIWNSYWPDPGAVGSMPGRVLAIPLEEYVVAGLNGTTKLASTVYEYPSTVPVNRAGFHPSAVKTMISAGRYETTKFTYNGTPLRLSAVDSYEGNAIASRSAYEYESGGGLLRKASVYNGASTEVQCMLVKYDPRTGLLLRRTDKNGGSLDDGGKFIQFNYDPYNRLETVCLKEGTTSFTMVEMDYPETTASPYWTRRKDYVKDGVWKETKTYNDNFGRPALTWTSVSPRSGSIDWVAAVKKYDILGRVKTEYGPSSAARSSICPETQPSGPGMPYTRHEYDGLGRWRRSSRYSAAGASLSSKGVSYGDSYNPLAATERPYDEEGRGNRLYKDGFGQIIQVDETPSSGTTWKTTYSYDLLGNLKSVNQPDHLRTFTYDCRGKLLSATLPETNYGVDSYSYNDQGAMKLHTLTVSGTLAIKEEFGPDGLGRTLSRTVTKDGKVVQTTTCQYDGDCAWGRLKQSSVAYKDTTGTTIGTYYGYDWKGMVTSRADSFSTLGLGGTVNKTYTTKYTHTPSGYPLSATYPSGVSKAINYGSGGVMATLKAGTGQLEDLPAVFSGITYSPAGGFDAATYRLNGASVKSVRSYDLDRLRWLSSRIGPDVAAGTAASATNVLFALDYGHEENGNVLTMNRTSRKNTSSAATTLNAAYTYDELNRLATYDLFGTNFSSTRYTYTIDQFGNLTNEDRSSGDSRAPASLSMQTVGTTNRLYNKPYDNLGNLLAVSGANGSTLTLEYFDQGHVSRVTGGSDGEYRYYYDAEGKRRIKAHGPVTATYGYSFFFYDGDDLVCQADSGDQVQQDPFYENRFLLTDHLGTTRAEMVVSAATSTPSILQTYDTTPYGRILETPAVASEAVVFTGKPRDKESGLDDFGARSYSKDLGRWTGVDPKIVSEQRFKDPQQWNLFAYARNNPMVFIDPDGKDILLAIWASYNGRIGHAGLAVMNYTKNGQPTGTYTYYDKWPAVNMGKNNASQSVLASYGKRTVTANNIMFTDVTSIEGQPPNGVVRIKTDAQTDKKVQEAMEAKMPYYNIAFANCTDYVKLGISAATGRAAGGKEQVGDLQVSTPNALYNFVLTLPNIVIEMSAGNTVKNSILDAIGNDPVKSVAVEKNTPSEN